jgi:putative tryptophan/tyrosine transport system substrate-binding protein
MKRREFITLLGGAAATWPMAARGQARMPVVGVLFQGDPQAIAPVLTAFQQGLHEQGFDEGRNVTIEYRWGMGSYDRMPSSAAELLQRQPNVIFTGGPSNVRTLQELTRTIPIVFSMGEDPVKEGVVTSLNRPGANVTGNTFFATLGATP